jgi:hypothetical protein
MRTVRDIAMDIKKCWKSPSHYAEPYIDAMMQIEKVSDNYICDTGHGVVLYFLANASAWRGEDARRIKQELRDLLDRDSER